MIKKIVLSASLLYALPMIAADRSGFTTPDGSSTPVEQSLEANSEPSRRFIASALSSIPAEFREALDRVRFLDGSSFSPQQREQIQVICWNSVYDSDRSEQSLQPITGSLALLLWWVKAQDLAGQRSQLLHRGVRRPSDIDIEAPWDRNWISQLQRQTPYFGGIDELSGVRDAVLLHAKSGYLPVEMAAHEDSEKRPASVNLFGMAVRPLFALKQGKGRLFDAFDLAPTVTSEEIRRGEYSIKTATKLLDSVHDLQVIAELERVLAPPRVED